MWMVYNNKDKPWAPDNIIHSSKKSTMAQRFPQDLIGTWTLVGFESHDVNTNHTIYPFGGMAIGLIIYTNDGFMSAQLMNPSSEAHKNLKATLHGP